LRAYGDRSLRTLGLKYEIMERYSGGPPCCVKCGQHDLHILELDHIKDNGGEERRRFTNGQGGTTFYYYLRCNGYPDGYQVLCRKCHIEKTLTKRKVNLMYMAAPVEYDLENPISNAQPQSLWNEVA